MNEKNQMISQLIIALKTGKISASKDLELISFLTKNNSISLENWLSSNSLPEFEINKKIINCLEQIHTKFDLNKLEKDIINNKRIKLTQISIELESYGIHNNTPFEKILAIFKNNCINIQTLSKEELSTHKNSNLIELFLEKNKLNRELKQFDNLVQNKNDNNIIQTNYNVWSSLSGRITSYSPCLQNLPSYYKNYYLPLENNHKLYELDITSAEIIALAHLSKESKVFDLLENKKDIYNFIGQEVFKILPNKVTPEIRKILKAITNGIFLGMSGDSIAQRINSEPFIKNKIDPNKGLIIKNKILSLFPNIKNFLDEIKNKSTLETYLGHEFKVKPNYKNLSFPAQNLVATILKNTLLRLHSKNLLKYVTNIIHDSLIISVPNDKIKSQIKDLFKECLEDTLLKDFKNINIELIKETNLRGEI